MDKVGTNIFRFSRNSNKLKKTGKIERVEKRTLLCLMDSAFACESLVKILEQNFELNAATTIFSALQYLKNETPSALIVQLHLKNENCFDFLRILSSNPAVAEIPIITCCVDDVFDKTIEDYLIKAAKVMGSDLCISCSEFYSPALASKLASAVDSKHVAKAS